jgi:hypothetical protein
VKKTPPGTAGGGVRWDKDQLAIITAPADARLLVDAGPGTGKTAVACARIAHLINNLDIEPTHVWLVSFTRTAVHELRNRIGYYTGDPARAAGIRIATIDSHAWAIHSGFRQDASLTGTYEQNIERVIELIRDHEGVFEYLSQLRHLVIDEAQDVIGPRCELILEMVNALPKETGATVLSDDAQAIYGFTEEENPRKGDGTLPEAIRKYMPVFKSMELTEIHRTTDRRLIRLFKEGRSLVTKGRISGNRRLENLRKFIGDVNHGHVGIYREDIKNLPKGLVNAFLLFRRRGEALEASDHLGTLPHRLRMSGLPTKIHEWVGNLFWDFTSTEMDADEFGKRWASRGLGDVTHKQADAWQILVRHVGITGRRISAEKLAARLSSGSPPMELCAPDFGFAGPVVGTIHGAKGREADEVRLYLATKSFEISEEDAEEETRVLFVGATRARQQLKIGVSSTKVHARRLDPSGRAFTPYPWKDGKKCSRSCVEIGRIGDIDPIGLAGRSLFGSGRKVQEAQESIRKLSGRISGAECCLGNPSQDFRYCVSNDWDKKSPICFLSRQVNGDMFKIAEIVDSYVKVGRRKPPEKIPFMRIFGTRTIAIGPDEPVRHQLHPPWSESGFMTAPMLLGYGMVWFRY